jgi:hypothetical protein
MMGAEVQKKIKNSCNRVGLLLTGAMTARQHLTVSADHIYFEGEARQLLNLEFV